MVACDNDNCPREWVRVIHLNWHCHVNCSPSSIWVVSDWTSRLATTNLGIAEIVSISLKQRRAWETERKSVDIVLSCYDYFTCTFSFLSLTSFEYNIPSSRTPERKPQKWDETTHVITFNLDAKLERALFWWYLELQLAGQYFHVNICNMAELFVQLHMICDIPVSCLNFQYSVKSSFSSASLFFWCSAI